MWTTEEIATLPLDHAANLAQGRHEPRVVTLYKDWTRLTSDDHGDLTCNSLHGFYCAETRFITGHRIKINGQPLGSRFSSQTDAHQWVSLGHVAGSDESGNLDEGHVPRGSIDIAVMRTIDGGMTERIYATNNSSQSRLIKIELELVCPIDDVEWYEEMEDAVASMGDSVKPRIEKLGLGCRLVFAREFGVRSRAPTQELKRVLKKHSPQDGQKIKRVLELECRAQDDHGRELKLHVGGRKKSCISILAKIHARGELNLELMYSAVIDGLRIDAPKASSMRPMPRLDDRDKFQSPSIVTGNSIFNLIWNQAVADFASLHLGVLNQKLEDARPEALIAGIPRYMGVFARDTLIASWQAAMVDWNSIDTFLDRIGQLGGVKDDPWRDEELNRLPHEHRLDPLACLGQVNREIYYGDVTSTPFWIIALSTLFAWQGDVKILRRHRDRLDRCCAWIRKRLESGKGFIYYAPAGSEKGHNRNQAWKDSGDAIVDGAGRIRTPPLALVEIQGYAYAALDQASRIYDLLGAEALARECREVAGQLKDKFNRKFWHEQKKIYVLALNKDGEQVDALASNAGHCLGTGIIADERLGAVMQSLLGPSMFSGWGVRTLASDNAAYDPYSYHRGTVWPVENAEIAHGMRACGFYDEANKIIGAQLAVASLTPHFRLPEVLSGHQRSERYPIPGLYPFANMLQAWSVSSVFQSLEVMLGLNPRASQRLLFCDPHLPPWLPWVEAKRIKIGKSEVDLHFWRDAEGTSRGVVTEKRGEPIEVIFCGEAASSVTSRIHEASINEIILR